MEFRIPDTFTASLERLTADEQKAAKTTAFDLQLNPSNPGIQLHRIDHRHGPGRGATGARAESRHLYLANQPGRAKRVETFEWPLRIGRSDTDPSREIAATVDTGAAYTVLPASLVQELGVEATDTRRLLLADGRQVDIEIGELRATVHGKSAATLVVFGDDGAPPLLGAYTLVGLGLAVDPAAQRLVPTSLIMYYGLFTLVGLRGGRTQWFKVQENTVPGHS